MIEDEKMDSPSAWRDVFSGNAILTSIVETQKDALRFARGGAIVGAMLGIGSGIYFFHVFGVVGVVIGLIAGAIICGIAAWLMYQLA